jgi:2-iminobutanoate/2-iminopropanoate deaminase
LEPPRVSIPPPAHLAGDDVQSQTRQILDNFEVMLESVGSDLAHIVHINVFLDRMSDFEQMNAAYTDKLGDHRDPPAPSSASANSPSPA